MSSYSAWVFVCESHEPGIADWERRGDVTTMRKLWAAREQLFALDDDFWPDEYRGHLYWLRQHRECLLGLVNAETDERVAVVETVPAAEPEGVGESPGGQVAGDDDLARRRGIVLLGHEDLLRAVGADGQGFGVRAVFADSIREAVAVVVTHPWLPVVEDGAVPTELRGRWEWLEGRGVHVDGGGVGEVCVRPRLLVDQLRG